MLTDYCFYCSLINSVIAYNRREVLCFSVVLVFMSLIVIDNTAMNAILDAALKSTTIVCSVSKLTKIAFLNFIQADIASDYCLTAKLAICLALGGIRNRVDEQTVI